MGKHIDVHLTLTALLQPRLPVEVFDRIIGLFNPDSKEDVTTLKSLCLVCHRFRKISQALLYSAIGISSDKGGEDDNPALERLEVFASCIASRPDLGYNIKQVYYSIKSADDDGAISKLANIDVFLKLPRIRSLIIRRSTGRMGEVEEWDGSKVYQYIPLANPTFGCGALLDAYAASGYGLKELHLQGVAVPIYTILLSCPQLLLLTLKDCTVSRTAILPSPPLPESISAEGFALRDLTLEGGIVQYFPVELFGYLRNVHFMAFNSGMIDMTGNVAVPLHNIFKNLKYLQIGRGSGIWQAFGPAATTINGKAENIFRNLEAVFIALPPSTNRTLEILGLDSDFYALQCVAEINEALTFLEKCLIIDLDVQACILTKRLRRALRCVLSDYFSKLKATAVTIAFNFRIASTSSEKCDWSYIDVFRVALSDRRFIGNNVLSRLAITLDLHGVTGLSLKARAPFLKQCTNFLILLFKSTGPFPHLEELRLVFLVKKTYGAPGPDCSSDAVEFVEHLLSLFSCLQKIGEVREGAYALFDKGLAGSTEIKVSFRLEDEEDIEQGQDSDIDESGSDHSDGEDGDTDDGSDA